MKAEAIDPKLVPADERERRHFGFKRLAGSSSKVLVLRLMGAALSYALLVVLARVLSDQDYGHYATIMSGLTFASVFCRFGTDVSVVRFLGEYKTSGQKAMAMGLVYSAERVVLSLAAGLAMFALIVFLLNGFPDGDGVGICYLLSAILVLPGFALLDTYSGVIRSYGGIVTALAPKDVLWRMVVLAVAAWLQYWLVATQHRLFWVTVVSGIGMMLLLLGQRVSLRRLLRSKNGSPPLEFDLKRWVQSSATLWIMLIARVSFRTLDVILVAAFLTVTIAGDYFLIGRTAELQGFVLASLNLIVGPKISSLYAGKRTDELQHFLAIVSLLLFAVSASVFVVCLVFGEPLLSLLGVQTELGWTILILLSLGQLINSSAGSVGVLLNMAGYERVNATVLIASSVLTIAGIAIVTPWYGAVGTAMVSAIGIAVWNLAALVAAVRYTGLDPSILGGLRLLYDYFKSGSSE